jgi:hypothetical protein
VRLDLSESDQLARHDGFKDWIDMMVFWEKRRPFRGDIIHWKFKGSISGENDGNGVQTAVPTARMQELSNGQSTILQRQVPHSRLEGAQRR